MPIGGSRSRSEWVAPKIFRAKDKVIWAEDWWQSTIASPYQLSQQTIQGTKGIISREGDSVKVIFQQVSFCP